MPTHSFSSIEQVSRFFLAPVCGSAFTLTLHFRINSNCVGTQSLLSKDVGKEAMTCELLPAIQPSLTGQVVTIIESPRDQHSAKI